MIKQVVLKQPIEDPVAQKVDIDLKEAKSVESPCRNCLGRGRGRKVRSAVKPGKKTGWREKFSIPLKKPPVFVFASHHPTLLLIGNK